jgi:type II secretory pathway pseudopilin PulG
MVVVLVVFGVVAGLSAPVLLPDRQERVTLARLLGGAREAAIARAQRLRLEVRATGEWRLVVPGAESTPIAVGRLSDVALATTVELSALGTCVVRQPLPVGWDAARCASRDQSTP